MLTKKHLFYSLLLENINTVHSSEFSFKVELSRAIIRLNQPLSTPLNSPNNDLERNSKLFIVILLA